MPSMQDVNELICSTVDKSSFCVNAKVIQTVETYKASLTVKKKTVPFSKLAASLLEQYGYSCSSSDQISSVVSRIQSVCNNFKKLTKSVSRNWDKIVEFLGATFEFPAARHLPPPAQNTTPTQEEKTPPPASQPQASPISTPVKTRRDCTNCSSAKKINVKLNQTIKKQKGTVQKFKQSAAQVKREYKVKVSAQKLKRQGTRIKVLKLNVRRLEKKLKLSSSQLATCISENKRILADLDSMEKKSVDLNKQINEFKSQCKKKEKEICEMTRYIENLETIVADQPDSDKEYIHSKKGKNYNSKIRLCVYHQLLYNVPVESCGVLLNKILKILCGTELSSVPSTKTCAQMPFEIGLLSSIQLMEHVISQPSLCLSWDATTIDGSHINEIHLTINKNECLVLDIRHLPGGTGSDYVSHIMGALTDAASVYSKYHQVSETETLSKLRTAITATLSDRAVVNSCVSRQLCDELDSQLLQLNCNIHPLDSVARDSKSRLVSFDTQHSVQGLCYGKEGSAANLIKAISTLRYKDGTGDPIGFKSFLRQHGLPMGSFPRYVGNRFHVLFHLAGLILLHQTKLQDFLENQCSAAAPFRTKILKDLGNGQIMLQIWALAVMGKIFSGPWMSKFYSSTMSNLEMGSYVRLCLEQLGLWMEDVEPLLSPSKNCFGEPLDPAQDLVVSAIDGFCASDREMQLDALTSLLSTTIKVLERQLSSFISGAFANPTEDMKSKASSAPTHNMSSERALGCLDRMWRQAPNATMGFLNGKLKGKLNDTLGWLEAKPSFESDKLIQFVIAEAKGDRAKKLLEHRQLLGEIGVRRLNVEAQRAKTKKNSLVKQIKLFFKTKD
ncbi:hypothetical protein ElyMa_002161200, partial [Elysia marginata]